ncbi:hypothetical protein [uncultured Clostridium sp.]|uniref:hypothetical protein n=1 Tax=uncultured Clostridium sp. TaxID=59620 RepID=UPI0025FA5C83|nr:hypothetical protein [uncultured Clostridium sp.]
MLKLTLVEFFLRTIPESFILMMALFILCNINITMKPYVMSSTLFGVCQYFIRRLPINYGVNTILGIFIMILIMHKINKSEIIPSIKSSLIMTIVLFILEWVNIVVLTFLFNDSLEIIFNNSILKILSGMPSLVLLALMTLIYYKEKGKLKIC